MENTKNHGSQQHNATTDMKDKDMNKKSNAGQQHTQGKTGNSSGGSNSSKGMKDNNDNSSSRGGNKNTSR